MYFLFSKILLFLLFPFSWAVGFLLIALFAKKAMLKRRSLIISAAILFVFSNPYLIYKFAQCWDVPTGNIQKGKVYSAAIVLGGFSGEDINGGGNFNLSADRFLQGIKLKMTGKAARIMITSGNGSLLPDGFSEGAWAKGQLKEFGFPDSVVLIEQRSRNTFENASFSKTILDKAHVQAPYLLITSAFHMRRSLYIFKSEGLNVVPYTCNYITGNSKLSFDTCVLPDANALSTWQIYLKEVVGLCVAHIKYQL